MSTVSRNVITVTLGVALLCLVSRRMASQSSITGTGWEVSVGSNVGDSTVLRPDRLKVPYFALRCSGRPPSFEIVLFPDEYIDSVDRSNGATGTVLSGTHGPHTVRWEPNGAGGVFAALTREVVESLKSAGDSLETKLERIGAAPLSTRFRLSKEFGNAVELLLKACEDHTLLWDRRQLVVDGTEVILDVEVDSGDLVPLRQLANDLGILDVERIHVGLFGAPTQSLAAKVTGRELRGAMSVTQTWLFMRHESWRTSLVVLGENFLRRGPWLTSPDYLFEDHRWIVDDDGETFEISFGPGVTQEVVHTVVRAIRRGDLVDARDPSLGYFAPLPTRTDLSEIPHHKYSRIERAPSQDLRRSCHEAYDLTIPRGSSAWLRARLCLDSDPIEVIYTGVSIV